MPLTCETNTPAIRRRVLAAAEVAGLSIEDPTPVYEHGQWWVVGYDVEDDRVIYAVNDAAGPGTVDGFDFELMP